MGPTRTCFWAPLGATAALAGCAAALPLPADPSEMDLEPLPAAFVVYLADATLLLPVLPADPGSAVLEADGLWLLSESGDVLRGRVRDREELAEELACLEGDAEGLEGRCPTSALDEVPLALSVVPLGSEGEPVGAERLAGSLEGCTCFGVLPEDAGEEADDEGSVEVEGEEADGAAPLSAVDDAAAPCLAAVEPYGAVSVVGGGVHLLARLDGSGCEGAPPVSFWSEAVTLDETEAEVPELAAESCVAGLPFDDWSTLDRPCPRSSRRPSCAGCTAPRVEAAVTLSWSGRLVELGIAPDDEGGVVTLVRSAPEGPEACPGEADPCGLADGFVGLDRFEASWVASDGVAGLGLAEGRLYVVLPGQEEPLWGGVEAGGEVIGVRYHEDATPLRDAMAGRP